MDTARKSSFCSSIIGFGSRVFWEGGRKDRGFERFGIFRKKSFEDFVEISTLDFLFSTLILGKRNWNVTKSFVRDLSTLDSNAHFGEVECNEISRFGDFVDEISS